VSGLVLDDCCCHVLVLEVVLHNTRGKDGQTRRMGMYICVYVYACMRDTHMCMMEVVDADSTSAYAHRDRESRST
jgi:hypothetical protein